MPERLPAPAQRRDACDSRKRSGEMALVRESSGEGHLRYHRVHPPQLLLCEGDAELPDVSRNGYPVLRVEDARHVYGVKVYRSGQRAHPEGFLEARSEECLQSPEPRLGRPCRQSIGAPLANNQHLEAQRLQGQR